MMKFGLVLPLRIVQVVFSLIVLGLSGYVAHWYTVDLRTSSPTQINFLIFAGLWSILSVVYLEVISKFVPKASHPWAALASEATSGLFFFAGFIALGVYLTRLLRCRGPICAAARADTTFAAFLFCVWAVTVALAVRDMVRDGTFRRAGARGRAGVAPNNVAMKENLALG